MVWADRRTAPPPPSRRSIYDDAIDPARAALVIMDGQQGIVERLGDPSPLMHRLVRAAGAARASGIRVPRQAEARAVDEWASGLPN